MLVLKYGQKKKFVPSNSLLGRTIVQTILNSISFNIWLYENQFAAKKSQPM